MYFILFFWKSKIWANGEALKSKMIGEVKKDLDVFLWRDTLHFPYLLHSDVWLFLLIIKKIMYFIKSANNDIVILVDLVILK